MAQKTKFREISIVDEGGTFNTFFRRFTGDSKEYDFQSLSLLRKLFSNEKARLLHTIKSKNPISIYHLAKILGRDFRSVSEDVSLLKRFGIIEMVSESTGNRKRLKPILSTDSLSISFKF